MEPDTNTMSDPYKPRLSTVKDSLTVDGDSLKAKLIAPYPQRNLGEAVMALYQVKLWHSTETGDIEYICFPTTVAGKIVGYITRKELHTKTSKWNKVGLTGCTTELQGQFICKPDRNKAIIICEGQIDTLACRQVIDEQGDEASEEYDVVSIGYGCRNALEHIKTNLAFVQQYGRVITAFDGDACTDKELKKGGVKGLEATYDCHINLLKQGCVLIMPKGCDLYDVVSEPLGSDTLWRNIQQATTYQPPDIHSGVPANGQMLKKPTKRGIQLIKFPLLMSQINGIRENELTVVIAPPKSGKTLFMKELALELMNVLKDGKCGNLFIASLEESVQRYRQSLVAIRADVPLLEFLENPNQIDDEIFNETLKLLGTTLLSDNSEGTLKCNNIVDMYTYLFLERGVRYFILDHLHFLLDSSQDNMTEKMQLDDTLKKIGRFCRAYPVHVFVVAHITVDKMRDNAARKEAKNEESYWYMVNELDARGTAAFSQVCDNMIGINACRYLTGGIQHTQLQVLLCRGATLSKSAKCETMKVWKGKGRFRLW